ncbi:protein kinase domain-containing protein [Tundrisphaera sp. TA3]|uniref:serine/threonine-protein kinase n=1 Tax=Tundrisphaera sp. TA3 TaxID=3435775 RepID=UPI003EB8E89E
MLDHKASRFYRSALLTGLIDEASLDACWDAIPDEKRVEEAIDRRLARQTITRGHLTLWQAQQILAGRTTGYRIDKYVLLDLIGRGGMGRVYLAKDVRLDRRVALKILSQERMTNPRAITRFQREAKVGAQLQHENLVRIYDEGESNGVRYLVMEYIEGKNIGQMIGESGAIPWPTAARLARQVALGLEHARLKGLIHRDVNPCNILVTTEGAAKLTDLGLAIDLTDQDNVTRDGATVGTFDYVSPEQARHSRSVDTRADLYSLGCTMFHMISGRVPFPVTSLPEKLYAHQLHDPEPLNELVPGVPEGLAAIVARLMRKNPDERQPTPQVLAQELEPYALEGGSSPSGVIPALMADHRAAPAAGGSAQTSVSPATEPSAIPDVPASWAATLGLNTDGQMVVSPETAGSGSASATARTDSFFPLDLGPEVPLSQGLRATAKAAKPARPPKPAKTRPAPADPDGPSGPRPPWRSPMRIAVAAGLLVAVVGLGVLAWTRFAGPGRPTPPPGQPEDTATGPAPIPPGEILVRGKDGRMIAAKTLAEAVARAARSGGEVVLTSATPIRLTNKATIIVPSGEPLVIRAAEGVRPVLEVQMAGALPMFAARSTISIKGLTVVDRRDKPTDAPLIDAERDLALERCAIRAEGETAGSRAILLRGGRASLAGCLLVGFDRPLDIEASPRSMVSLKQSILRFEATDAAAGGAIHVLNAFGPRGAVDGTPVPACQLTVESCSIAAGSFLDVNQFAEATPLEVKVSRSAFRVRSLLDLGVEKPNPGDLPRMVRWDGKDNRFQVDGPGWVTVPGVGPMPDGPADLDAWAKLMREADGEARAWKAAPDPADPSSPADQALIGEDGTAWGADPGQVGPNASAQALPSPSK